MATLGLALHDYYVFRRFDSDKAIQVQGAYELLRGNGVSLVSHDLTSLEPLKRPIVDWPPGYSYAVAAVGALVDKDLYVAWIVLDFLTIAGLWVLLLWVTRLLGFTHLETALLLLFLSLSRSSLPIIWSSDLIGVVLFLLSGALVLALLERRSKPVGRVAVFFFLAQFLLAVGITSMKYSLLPAVFAVPLSLVIYGAAIRVRRVVLAGLVHGALAAAGSGLVFVYNLVVGGEATRLSARHGNAAGIHFENLLHLDPFIVRALVFLDPITNRADARSVIVAGQVVTLLVIAAISLVVARRSSRGTASFFDALLVTTLVLVPAFLCVLSLKYPADRAGSWVWTYVREQRYFAPAVLLFILYCFRGVTLSKRRLRPAIVFAALAYAVSLRAYYAVSGNLAGSFETAFQKTFAVADYVESVSDTSTYFLSLSGRPAFDAEVTSLVATRGIKVAVTYFDHFPDSTFVPALQAGEPRKTGARIIAFLGQDSLQLQQTAADGRAVSLDSNGGKYLFIER